MSNTISIHRDDIAPKELIDLLQKTPNTIHLRANIESIQQDTSKNEKSLLDMIGASQGRKSFDSADEINSFIREERNEWEK